MLEVAAAHTVPNSGCSLMTALAVFKNTVVTGTEPAVRMRSVQHEWLQVCAWWMLAVCVCVCAGCIIVDVLLCTMRGCRWVLVWVAGCVWGGQKYQHNQVH